jgi:glucose/arabinose dehydrogenase
MRSWRSSVVVALALWSSHLDQSGVLHSFACDPNAGGIRVPAGLCAVVFADELGSARHLTVSPTGDVFVILRVQRRESEVGAIVALRDTNGDGRADVTRRFGSHYGTSIEWRLGHLYVASETEVVRYQMPPGALVPHADPEVVVTGIRPNPDVSHRANAFTFDDSGRLYLALGAPSDACQAALRQPGAPGLNPCPQLQYSGGIWRFTAATLGQRHEHDGVRFATGVRHAVAIGWHPAGHLFAVQHGRGDLSHLWPNRFSAEASADLPSEELLLIREGADYGWPYCFHDTAGMKHVLAPEYDGDKRLAEVCASLPPPALAFPAHMAPDDILFYRGATLPARYRSGAFVSFRGGYGRYPLEQRGYLVAFVPFNSDGLPIGGWEVFADGFAGSARIRTPRDAVYRPVGLAEGPDGSLYISEDVTGRIWRITPSA